MNELQPIETEVAGQRPLFDYAALDAETRIVVQQRAGEIKSIGCGRGRDRRETRRREAAPRR